MGRRFDATTGRAADAGVESHGFRLRRAAVGEQRRHDRKIRSSLAVHIVRAPGAPPTAPGTRGGRDAYDMHDLRGQGDRPALRYHHVRRVSIALAICLMFIRLILLIIPRIMHDENTLVYSVAHLGALFICSKFFLQNFTYIRN